MQLSNSLAPGSVMVESLWEKFRLYHSKHPGLKDRLFRLEKLVYEDFWALKDVSLRLNPGDCLAIIGSNGSGKSTLLKCLAGILPSDQGTVRIGGRVASLLELGAGFHGDLSGRENIFLNGSILGLRRREIEKRFEEIVEFSGIGEFIDSPVRNYSSGMYVRLGFAIAVHVDPDVLLIDEVLAVGDATFQTSCFEKMRDFKRSGKTIVLVTHDLDTAGRLCEKALLLEKGQVVTEGASRRVINHYRQINAGVSPGSEAPSEAERWGSGDARILTVSLVDENDRPIDQISSGQRASFLLRVRFDSNAVEPVFGYILRSDDGTEVHVMNTMWRGISTGRFGPTDLAEVRFTQSFPLLPGKYLLTSAVAHQDGTQWYDWWEECLAFHVLGPSDDHGIVDLRSSVQVTQVVDSRQGWAS